jgi:hypothetical protein
MSFRRPAVAGVWVMVCCTFFSALLQKLRVRFASISRLMNDSGSIADSSADFAQLLVAARSGDRVAVGTLLEPAYLRASRVRAGFAAARQESPST